MGHAYVVSMKTIKPPVPTLFPVLYTLVWIHMTTFIPAINGMWQSVRTQFYFSLFPFKDSSHVKDIMKFFHQLSV